MHCRRSARNSFMSDMQQNTQRRGLAAVVIVIYFGLRFCPQTVVFGRLP